MGLNGVEKSSFSWHNANTELLGSGTNASELQSDINALVEYVNLCKH